MTHFVTTVAENLALRTLLYAYFTLENTCHPWRKAGDRLTALRLSARLAARMDLTLSNEKRTITYKIKLEKSMEIILFVVAIAIFANAFQFTVPIKDVMAELGSGATLYLKICHSGSIRTY